MTWIGLSDIGPLRLICSLVALRHFSSDLFSYELLYLLSFTSSTSMGRTMDVGSSAAAFIGLADVVLRTGSKIYDFLAAVKDAPHEIENLQRELGTINSLVAEVRAYCEDLTIVQPCSSASQMLLECTCLLVAIQQDLEILASAATSYDASTAFARTWAKVKWVFADKKISRLACRLESNKLSLVAAFTLHGRSDGVVPIYFSLRPTNIFDIDAVISCSSNR